MPTDEAYQEILRRLDEKDKSMSNEQTAEVDAEIGGQKLKYNGPINTLATIATLILVCLLVYAFWNHQQDAKEAGQGFKEALKDQTSAMREQTVVLRKSNCIQTYPGTPQDKESACERLSR